MARVFAGMVGVASVVAMAVVGALVHAPAQAQIRVGQTAGITGPVAAAVSDITVGAKLYLDHVNETGGVGGQKIEMVSLDDEFQVPLAVANARKLIADPKVVALFLSRGTPHAQAMLPLLSEAGIALVAPSTGAMVLHEPVHPWVFNVRTTYQREAEAVTRHLGQSGLERVAVLYVNDSFGEDALQGALKVFKAAGKVPVVLGAIDRNKPDYAEVVPKIMAVKPLGVLMIGSGASVAAGVAALRAAGSRATIATLSNNASAGFVKGLGEHATGVVVSQVFPPERRLAVSMIAEAVRLADARQIKQITPAMVEGFAAAKVLVAGLRRAHKEGRERVVSRAGLKRALETLKRLDIGGLELSYSPTDHSGFDFSDLSYIGPDGSFRR